MQQLALFQNLLRAVEGLPRLFIFEEDPRRAHSCQRKLCIRHDGHWDLFDTVKRGNLTWLFYAEIDDLTDIFPAKRARIEGLLGTIAVQRSYWSKSNLHKQHILSKLDNESKD